MELRVTTVPGQDSSVSTISVADSVFGVKFRPALVHQVVTAYSAGGRAGTRAQKTRSEVHGGGIKPWRQKGTGRARAGTSRSPIWRKGGVTFAAKTADFSQKINKKMFSGAMRSIFSELARQERLTVVEKLSASTHKTRELLKTLSALSLNEVLIITNDIEPNLYLAARNLPHVEVRDVEGVDPVSLIGFEKVLVTLPALKKIEEKWA